MGWKMGDRAGISSLFTGRIDAKKRGECKTPPRLKLESRTVYASAQGAIGFIVGIRPMFGLPTLPWADAMRRVDSEVVPQQSFLGQ